MTYNTNNKKSLYIEDINAAMNLKQAGFTTQFIANLFNLNENQTTRLETGTVNHLSSINCPTNRIRANRLRGRDRIITPRMTSAAATLRYMGYTNGQIASYFNCDDTTISKNLTKYHGYSKKITK